MISSCFKYQDFLNKQNQLDQMDNIIDKQISSFVAEPDPINSPSVKQSNEQLEVGRYEHFNSDRQNDKNPKQSSLEANQFLQSKSGSGQHNVTSVKNIRNPEIQAPSSPMSKQFFNTHSDDIELQKASQGFQYSPKIQNDSGQNFTKPKNYDRNYQKLGLASPEISDLKHKANPSIHIRKLKSGFIYNKKPQQQVEQSNILSPSNTSRKFRESPNSTITKQRNSPRKKQITQMTQILKMLEIRLASFENQSEAEQRTIGEQKEQPLYSVQPQKHDYTSGLNQIPLKHDQKSKQSINKGALLPTKQKIQDSLNKRNNEIRNYDSEKSNQYIIAQSGYPQRLNKLEISKQQLNVSIEKQALQRQIERLNKTIRQLKSEKDQSKSPQTKHPLSRINQQAHQHNHQVKFSKKSKKKIQKPSSNRLLDAGKIVHLSSTSVVPINSNISFSRLAKEIDRPQSTWQVPLLEVQFRDIFVPAIPNPPNSNSSQEQLQKLAQKVYGLLGVVVPQGNDLAIRKYKNCVLFDVQHRQNSTILWHYSGKFYFGGWCKNIGEKHGSGLEVVPKKYSYQGQFLKGKRHGSGVLRTHEGQIYDGQWFQGSRHGRGAHLDPTTKAVFNGEWKFDQKEGQGWLKISTKQYYFGIFSKGAKEGFGLEQLSNGDTYRGQYRKGKFHGRGCYYWSNGARYQGDFLEGLRQGLGSWRSPEGTDIYIGSYKGDHKCGYGRYISGSGCIYEGEFDKDSRHGKGRLTYPDGTQVKGIWKQGVLVPMQNMRNQHEERPLTRNNRQFPSNFFTPKKNRLQQH